MREPDRSTIKQQWCAGAGSHTSRRYSSIPRAAAQGPSSDERKIGTVKEVADFLKLHQTTV